MGPRLFAPFENQTTTLQNLETANFIKTELKPLPSYVSQHLSHMHTTYTIQIIIIIIIIIIITIVTIITVMIINHFQSMMVHVFSYFQKNPSRISISTGKPAAELKFR